MGMSASQARFLSLTARKTNVEYEGQQINQQRTTLSNQTASYYSELTNMAVPTPPSTTDYTKTTYSFNDGNEVNVINTLIAQKNGYYIVNYTHQYKTESVVSNGNVIVSKQETPYPLVDENGEPVLDTNGEQAYGTNSDYYIGASKLRDLGSDDPDDTYLNSLDEKTRQATIAVENQYLTMLQEKYNEDDWFVRYQLNSTTGTYDPVFYSKNQIVNAEYSESTGASLTAIKSYVYGETTETHEIVNAKARVQQDSMGRYTSIIIYETDQDGNIIVENGVEIGTEYALDAATITDDNAYNDAMNEYKYKKTVYEQSIQEINAKIEVVHAQDKDLELRLKQLDTEQNAINTEMEAVKKVISKNVDSTFKTFNA